jgi:hypothetical protein
MNKKTVFQIVLIVLLLGGAIYLMAQFFKPGKIQILCDIHAPRVRRSSNNHQRATANLPQFEIAFGLDQQYELTSVKVVPLDEWMTNKETQPLWHLISESNSAPTRAFLYGMRIRGMQPAVKGARAEPLQTNVTYHLIIQAGSREGECDFKLPIPRETAH